MKTMILRFLLKCEIYGHEVDAYLAKRGGNYQFAADCIMRKMRAVRRLDLLGVNHG